MADGRITIDVDVNGKSVKVVTKDIEQLEQSAGQGAKGVGEVERSLKGIDGKPLDGAKNNMKGFGDETNKGKKSVKDFVTALGLVKIAGAVFNTLKDSVGKAVERFDTLEKFPKVMQSMGFEAAQSERAMVRMSNSIEGLPTTLNDMVGLTQKFVNITGDLDKSVDIAEALNNAMLASGSSSADAARGIEQYSQMLANGKVDMMSWRSLNETMGYGLKRVAEEMLGAGSGASDLYAALKSGNKTFDEVNAKIIELGGTTGELATLARQNSEGIGTSFANLKNAVVKGLANTMSALNEVVKDNSGKTIAKNLDGMKVVVNKTFDAINSTIKKSGPIIKAGAKAFDVLTTSAKTLSPAIIAVLTAYAGVKVVNKANAMFEKSAKSIEMAKKASAVMKISLNDLTIAQAKQMAGLEATNIATKKELEATLASQKAIGLKNTLLGLMTGQLTLAEVAEMGLAKASAVLKGAFDVLAAHPLVLALSLIVGALTAIVAINKKVNKSFHEEQKAIQDSTEEIKENTAQTEDNIRKRQNNIGSIEDQVDAAKKMVDQLGTLTSTEKTNADGKAQIKENVAELNRLYPELNLQYDDSTNKINQNTEAIKSQIDAYSAYDKIDAIQKNLSDSQVELNDARAEGVIIQGKLKDTQDQLADAMENDVWKVKDLHESVVALQEQYEANGQRQKELTEEQKYYLEQQNQAQEEAVQFQKDCIQRVGLQYDFLNDKQKEVVDSMKESYAAMKEASTSFTSDLSYDLDMSAQDMINFVENNQRIMSQWGDNLATLTKRGADEGFIEQLRQMGPEGAKYAEIAVNMSDDEFNKMNELFAGSSKITEDAWKKAYGMDNIDPAILSLVEQGKMTMQQALSGSGINELLAEQGKDDVQAYADSITNGQTQVGEATKGVTEAAKNGIVEGQIGAKAAEEAGFIGPKFGEGAESSKESVRQAVEGITSSAKEVLSSQDLLNNFLEQGQMTGKGFSQGIGESSEDARTASTDMAQKAIEASRSTLGVHSPSTVFAEIGSNLVAGLVQGITSNLGQIAPAIQALKNSLTDPLKGIKAESGASMQDYTAGIIQALTRSNNAAQSNLNAMKSKFQAFNTFLQSSNRTSMNQYTASNTQGFNRAKSVTTSALNQMQSQHRNYQSQMLSVTRNGSNNFASSISSGMSRAQSVTASGASSMIGSLSRLQSGFYSAGVNASYGLASGINAGSGSAIAAANSLAAQVTATMKSALKVHSPSRVMRDEIGRFIPQGIAEGIEEDTGKALSAMRRLSDLLTITPERALGVGRMSLAGVGGQIVNNTYNSQAKDLPPIYIKLDGSVEMDHEQVGTLVAPTVKIENNRIEKMRAKVRG